MKPKSKGRKNPVARALRVLRPKIKPNAKGYSRKKEANAY